LTRRLLSAPLLPYTTLFRSPGVPKSLSVPRTSLAYNLEVSARRYPGKAALHYYGTTVTYAELLRSVEALAGWLQRACGVARGDRSEEHTSELQSRENLVCRL